MSNTNLSRSDTIVLISLLTTLILGMPILIIVEYNMGSRSNALDTTKSRTEALDSEIEAVKKVIEKNIKKKFKNFN